MGLFEEKIREFSGQYRALKNDAKKAEESAMPGRAFVINGGDILSIPRDDGDCRYQYGRNGLNFWTYTSGYMHGNEGLFSLFLRSGEGQEPKIAFFAGVPKGNGYSRIPLFSVPRAEDDENYKIERYVVFSRAAAYYMTEMEGLLFAVRAFVGKSNEIVFSVYAENLDEDRARDIYLSSFLNPFLAHDYVESSEYRWFREVSVIDPAAEDPGLPSFLIKVNEDISRTQSVSNYGVIRRSLSLDDKSKMLKHEETASRYQYVGGSRSSLHTSKALRKGTFGSPKKVCTFTETGTAGDMIRLEIAKGGHARLDISLDCCFNDAVKDRLLSSVLNISSIEKDLLDIETSETKRHESIKLVLGASRESLIKRKVFEAFFEHLKRQVEFCSLVKGYVQLTNYSLIGIRDIFQSIEALLYWEPREARAKMLEALDFIAPDGRCPRQYSLPQENGGAPAMDLRPFIDQGVWVISTINTYIKVTGDFEFLNESRGYHEIVDEKAKLVRKLDFRDTVLEHMFKIMDFLIGNIDEKTHCVHALYGDWNDALDGLGVSRDPGKEYGTGVSVMVTLQLYKNFNEMIELLERLDAHLYESIIKSYKNELAALKSGLLQYAVICDGNGEKRILHGWGDDRSYLVGSFKDPDDRARTGLTSNAFWVLSKLYDEDMSMGKVILDAFERLDSKYGLKTFEPYFERNTPGVGRIPKLPAGTAENGAAYAHASAFGIMALFRMGYPEEAWKQLYKTLPFTHDKVSHSPFVMPNSYCCNEEMLIDGESMSDWQSGSSNTVMKIMINYIFGIEAEFDGIWIQPAGWVPFDSFEFSIRMKSCSINIIYRKTGLGKRVFRVNGTERKGVYSKIMRLERLWLSNDKLKKGEVLITMED